MAEGSFSGCGAFPHAPGWEQLIRRERRLYAREQDIRSPFERDYTRVLHSMAYRRLKHKTQVFFHIDNDHICTRMEHVSHVASVSSSIARALGLNDELTNAISIAHDLGHAPFGHQGEAVIRQLSLEHLGRDFWHEQNGLRFVDKLELLEDDYRVYRNLDLTWAVRDGIICHCGEVDDNGIRPRDLSVPIEAVDAPGKYQAATWEGCVVKMADKIAYVGRDIEDALTLGILDESARSELLRMARVYDQRVLNTTVIMHNMILDICRSSSPEEGIRLSPELSGQLREIKDFNYRHIYRSPRLTPYVRYSQLVLTQLFDTLAALYDGKHSWAALAASRPFAPTLISSFSDWLARYCLPEIIPDKALRELALNCENEKLFGALETRELYLQAVIDFISGMTDRFAVAVFNELLQFGQRG